MAASSGAIRAGRAFVEIFGDDSALDRTLKGIQTKLKGFGSALTSAGGGLIGAGSGMVAPLIAAAVGFAKAGSELNDASKRTGVAGSVLSELAFAAEQTGANLGDVEAGMRGMAKFSAQVDAGGKKATGALKSLGLSAGQLAGLSPEDKFFALADAVSKVADPTQRAAVAMQIFGKSGVKLLPMFEGGAGAMKAMTDQARALGLAMSDEDIAAADAMGDSLDSMWSQLKMVGVTIGGAVAPMLMQLVGWLQAALPPVIEFIRANGAMIGIALAVGAALVAAGSAISALGFVFIGISAAVGALAATFSFLLSPLGLVMAGLVALGAWVATNTSIFDNLLGDATGAFSAIKTALAGGDWGAAAAVGWGLIKLEWTKGVGFLTGLWRDFSAEVQVIWIELSSWISDAVTTVAHTIAGIFELMSEYISQAIEIVLHGDAMNVLNDPNAHAGSDALRQSLDESLNDSDKKRQQQIADVRGQQGFDSNTMVAEAELATARAEYEKAIAAAQAVPAVATDIAQGKNPETGGNLGNLGSVTASMGTFSNMAGRVLGGPDSGIVSALDRHETLLQTIADNTSEDEG